MTPQRGRRVVFGAAIVAVALAALVKCSGSAVAPLTAPIAAIDVSTPTPESTAVSTPSPPLRTKGKVLPKVAVAKTTPKKKKKLRADVAPKDFVVSGVSVSQTGYTAKIEGWVRMTRKGALAQPRMTFDLKDGNGDLIHAGSFTPLDATGPVWLGYDELGLKRVSFSTTVDLRAEDGGVLPSVPPRPYSASVRVAEVIDAKPSK